MRRMSLGDRMYALCAVLIVLMCAIFVAGCSSSEGGSSRNPSTAGEQSETSGPSFTPLASPVTFPFESAEAVSKNGASIDTSHVSDGVVSASVTSPAKCKFQVIKGEMTYNYDIPSDGEPIVVPVNMGSGSYTFRVMQNTSGNNYVELQSVDMSVTLKDEFAPFLAANVMCNFDASSAVVAKARELASGAENEGDVLRNIYSWVIENISYDKQKASELASATGYIPDPDATLASGDGICFDYASLTGAMLRSLGIPTKVMTGYVDPDSIYHSWNMVYIDGTWHSVEFSVPANEWTRIDTTFGASGASDTIGSGSGYVDRYSY